MIKNKLILGVLIGLFSFSTAEAQITDSLNNPLFLNSYGLQPVLLQKGKCLAQFNVTIPHFYKWYSPKTGTQEPISSSQDINEAYFRGILTYGVSNQLNLYFIFPVNDLHYYSPMRINKGIGLGDIQVGINGNFFSRYQNANNKYTAGITLGLPTGKYYGLKPGKLPTGTGSISLRGNITGVHKAGKFNILYSAHYTYLTNHSAETLNNETGGYLVFQKPFNTKVGQFGVETSAYTYYKFNGNINNSTNSNTKNYGIDLGIGGWFNYQKNLSIRFNVPFSIYQDEAWLTMYQVMTEIDYMF